MGNNCISTLILSKLVLMESHAKREEKKPAQGEKRSVTTRFTLTTPNDDEQIINKENPLVIMLSVIISGHQKDNEETKYFELDTTMAGEFSVKNEESHKVKDLTESMPLLAPLIYAGLKDHMENTIIKMDYPHSLIPVSPPEFIAEKS